MLKVDLPCQTIRIQHIEDIYTMAAYIDDKEALNIVGTGDDVS